MLLAGVALAALVFAAAVVQRVADSTRGTPLGSLHTGAAAGAPAVRSAHFLELITLMGAVTLAPGHDVWILADAGDSFARLFDDLRSARRSISLQSYYCLPGSVADTVVTILTQQARAGVRVRVLADGYGCRLFARRHGPALRAAGADVALLRPVRWYSLDRAQHRSHVRLVVVDGVTAYTGGFGLDDKWLPGASGRAAWRDTNVRYTGPAVWQTQSAFVVAWAEATRELVLGEELFARELSEEPFLRELAPPSGGGALAGIQFSGPGLGTSAFERVLLLTIAGARERLYVANAYFLPNDAQRRELVRAAARGVDVRILTAGDRSDAPSTRIAARGRYHELLRAGVRIYEYRPTMMHAKTLVADGVFSMIGSMNFDNRSMRLNDELNLLIHDERVARVQEALFAADLGHSIEITPEPLAARSWYVRLRERAARLVEPLL
jgi:cardiolipin synthase A/B